MRIILRGMFKRADFAISAPVYFKQEILLRLIQLLLLLVRNISFETSLRREQHSYFKAENCRFLTF